MAPKQAKKGSAKKSSAKPAANKNWEAGLVKEELEEESWRVCVSFVVVGSPEDEELTQALAQAAQKPLRRLFSLLTFDSTLAKIQELGNPKAKKPDDVPVYYEVTEPAKVLLDAGQEIPCDLMAKILKFQLLQIKASDQQRREEEQANLLKPEEEKPKAAPPSAKDKGGAKASNKKGGSAPTPMEPPREKKTQLKRRDDVDSPIFIDDEPEDGPQHYVLVMGFHQPDLIKALDSINVHIANIIKLCSDHSQTSEELQEKDTCDCQEENMGPDPEAEVIKVTEGRKFDLFWSGLRPVLDNGPPESKLHDVVQLSYTVQDQVPPLQNEEPEADLEVGSQIFEGVANLIYDSLDWRRQHQHYLNNMKLISVPTVQGLDPQPAEKSTQEGNSVQGTERLLLSTVVDMCHYNSLLDLVPPEACSLPLMLHSMLEQVVISEKKSIPHQADKEPKPDNSSGLDPVLLGFMLESFLPLLDTQEEKKQLLNKVLSKAQNEDDKEKLLELFGEETPLQKSEQPQIIRQHDGRALRFRDIKVLEGFDPVEVESSMMRLFPVCELIHSVTQQRNTNSCWMATKQQLQHHCTDDVISWPEVERLLQQSVFESMPLSQPNQKGILVNAAGPMGSVEQAEQQKLETIPWDNPPSYAKQKLKDRRTKGPTFVTEDPGNAEISGRVGCQLDLSDVQTCRLRSLFDWHYAEHHSASIFPQVLQLASEEYSCLDTFRGSLKNTMYIFCHNPMSPDYQCETFWDVTLRTDVKFRKYLEHVARTISDWTKEEELKREEMSHRSSSPVKSPEVKKEEMEEDTLNPVIRKDSLKAWKLEQEQLKEEETSKKSKKDNTPKSRQQKEEAKPTDDKKSKALTSGKKSRAETANSSDKTKREPVTSTVPPVGGNKKQHPTQEVVKRFTGYSMDGKLIHVSGRLQSLYPTDGGRITVENISFVEGSSLMKVAVNKDGHNFFVHINHVVVDQVTPLSQPQNQEPVVKESDPVEKKQVKQGSFSAVLDNGIRLSYSYYGPTGEHRVSTLKTETSAFLPCPPPSSSQHSESAAGEGQPALTSTPFNSLNLSLPNGLVLQFLKEETEGVSEEEQGISVKQGFPLHGRGVAGQLQDSSLGKELSRIITSKGTVIQFMRDRSTQVLFADGTVSVSQDSGPVWVPDSDLVEEKTSQEAEGTTTSQTEELPEKDADSLRGFWLTTTPSGARIHTVGTTHKHIPTTPLLVFKSTDPLTHEVMLKREDLVISVQNPEGSRCVEHADGTRITSIYQDRAPNTPHHLHLHPGEHRGSVTLRSSSVFACGCIDCVCDTRCADRITEKVQIQDTCGEKTSRGTEEKGFGQAECEHRCSERENSSEHEDDEESMFAGKNGKKSSCDNEKGSLASKEQLVLVEKEGCATVVMYPERHTTHVFLADGTVITGNNQGVYQVFPSKVGLLQIQTDGKCVYTSDPPVTPSPNSGTLTNQPGSYTMSHTDKVACDITDPDGNHFQVMEDGQLSVLNFSPAPSTMKQDEEEPEEEEEKEMARIHAKHREHCPRLFVVHEDGSGTELLSSQTVGELLYQAYSDPTIAVLKEPLLDTQDEFGITILKPSQQSVWSQWLLGKQNPDINPSNLRNRTWHDFPRTEVRVPGPPFGTNLGQGLTLKETWRGSPEQRQPIRDCPKVLEIRELYQHRPITASLRNTIDTRLKEYIESVMEREQRLEDMKIKDPRTKEEIVHASDLLNLVLSFAEDEEAHQSFEKRTPEDIANLYSQGVEAPTELDVSEDSVTLSSDSFTSEKESKWAVRLAQHRQEISEETVCREALRNKNVVPYFHPENNPLHQELFLSTMTRPDMRSLSMALPPIPRSESAEANLKDAPQENTPRPLNPTPSKSASRTTQCGRMLNKRPTNPETEHRTGQSITRDSLGQTKPVQVDVTGKPRKTKVRLPASILSSKPSSVPNHQFLSVEEPVRRKCKTISLTNSNVIVRGFQLLPSSVDFGTLQEGTSATISVVMKNVGVDTCRFHVKQPPPATGLRVIYNHGPVAAGLHVELQVQLFGMCAVQAGEAEPKKCITHDIIINTEMEILYLPVTAHILPGRLYDAWLKDHNKKGSKGRQDSSSRPAGRGFI